MQSPESLETNKSSHCVSNSKLHTPCRQIGLRRKKSRMSDTPVKENKSPMIKTLENKEIENWTSDTPVKESKSPMIKTVENEEIGSWTLDTPIKESKSPMIKTVENEENYHTPITPRFLNISDDTISVDKSLTEESCKLPKAKEDRKLTPASSINSGNSQDVKKEVEAVKKRIKEKEEKIAALKLAKLYRKKHDTNTLSELTERWREGCQSALQELLSTSTARGYQLNMTQLISQLGIPFELIRYNPDLEDFE